MRLLGCKASEHLRFFVVVNFLNFRAFKISCFRDVKKISDLSDKEFFFFVLLNFRVFVIKKSFIF